MLFDKECLFSDAQAITNTAVSTNVIKAKGEIGFGTPKPLRIQVVEDFATLTSLEIEVQTSKTEDFNTYKTLATTGAIVAAYLKAGYVAAINYIPKGNLGFMRLNYKVTGSNATAGKITAGIVAGDDASYQDYQQST